MTTSGRTGVRIEVDQAVDRPTVVWLDNGTLRIGAVPALGGRLLSVQIHGVEMLWRNPALLDDDLHPVAGHRPSPSGGSLGDWANYGGDKTWPAPQGWDGPDQWAGPPDPVLDSGPYSWSTSYGDGKDAAGGGRHGAADRPGAGTLTMVSADDPRTGLQLTRSVTLHPDSAVYRLDLQARNTSNRVVTWSLWNVTQRPGDGPDTSGVLVGTGKWVQGQPPPDVTTLIEGTATPTCRRLDASSWLVPHQDVVGKVGFPTANGSINHRNTDTTFEWQFAPDPSAAYPDHGSRVEVWLEHPLDEPLTHLGGLNPPDRIVEVEVLGPLVELPPGAETALSITCRATTHTADPPASRVATMREQVARIPGMAS